MDSRGSRYNWTKQVDGSLWKIYIISLQQEHNKRKHFVDWDLDLVLVFRSLEIMGVSRRFALLLFVAFVSFQLISASDDATVTVCLFVCFIIFEFMFIYQLLNLMEPRFRSCTNHSTSRLMADGSFLRKTSTKVSFSLFWIYVLLFGIYICWLVIAICVF